MARSINAPITASGATMPCATIAPMMIEDFRATVLAGRANGNFVMKGFAELSNSIRSHLSEFGIVAAIGRRGIDQLLAIVEDEKDTRVPADARLCLQMLAGQLAVVKEQILENDRRVRAIARQNELGRRLMEVPGVGPLLASAFIATIADPAAFKTGRDLAAWIGLVPKQNSSGGKERLGSIKKAGNRYLRQMLVVGDGSDPLCRTAWNAPPVARSTDGAPLGKSGGGCPGQ